MENITGKNVLHKIGPFSASNIVIANMVGAGIFTTSGLIMSGIGNPWFLIILWVTGGIIALCGALSYAELGAAMPQAGGDYIFLSRLYSPLFGFLSGWVSFVAGFSAPIAASAIGFSEYLFRAFPELAQVGNHGLFPGVHLDKILAIALILLFTLIHLHGLKFGSKIQNWLTIMKVLLLVVLIVAGLSFGKGNFTHLSQGTPANFNFSTIKTFGLSLMWVMFAYSGWNASTYIGSEIKNPERNIPRSLLFGTGIVMILYVLLNLVFVYATPPEEMKGVISIGGLTVKNLFGSSMDFVFSLLIAFALFSSLSAFIILGPRIYYSMARDGYFFKFAANVHPKYKVPSAAIIVQAVMAIIIVLSGTFDQILTYMGFSLGIFPVLAVAGVFKLRAEGNNKRIIKVFPVHLILYLFFGVMILLLSYLERPVESSIALATAVAGIPFFYYFKKMKSLG